jgi:ribosomal protein L14E/L6E/L27E
MKRSSFTLRIPDPKARAEVPVHKAKKCRQCKETYTPVRSMQLVCSGTCGIAYAQAQTVKSVKEEKKAERKAVKEKLQKLEPISYWEKKAEAAVNWYVRTRDAKDGCISCHLPASWDGQWHASHFRSVGAASAVRFNLWNINKACSVCNNWKSGNLSEYEPRIRAKLGNERVDWLRAQNQITRYSREYLERLARVFNKKARRLEKRNGQ